MNVSILPKCLKISRIINYRFLQIFKNDWSPTSNALFKKKISFQLGTVNIYYFLIRRIAAEYRKGPEGIHDEIIS